MYANYCFTLNNYSNFIEHPDILYSIQAEEVGTEGTKHLQGYLELAMKKRLSSMKKQISYEAHWEPRRGTQKQAIDYCKKDGKYVESGVRRKQGRRNDLDGVRQLALIEGLRPITCLFNLQQIKVAEKFLSYNEKPRKWKPFIYWLWGNTGAGKSRTARELCTKDTYIKNGGSKWWTGYDGHECVIIDDIRTNWFKYTELLALLDRYEKQVETKGGHRQFKPRLIVVTSLYHPCLFEKMGEDNQQLLRRIDCVTNVTEVAGNTMCCDL